MSTKLIAAALFSMALGLFAVAWSIHDHTQRHGRYAFEGAYRLDTLTGQFAVCDRTLIGDESQDPCFPEAD
jgi:hypothetical protein